MSEMIAPALDNFVKSSLCKGSTSLQRHLKVVSSSFSSLIYSKCVKYWERSLPSSVAMPLRSNFGLSLYLQEEGKKDVKN